MVDERKAPRTAEAAESWHVVKTFLKSVVSTVVFQIAFSVLHNLWWNSHQPQGQSTMGSPSAAARCHSQHLEQHYQHFLVSKSSNPTPLFLLLLAHLYSHPYLPLSGQEDQHHCWQHVVSLHHHGVRRRSAEHHQPSGGGSRHSHHPSNHRATAASRTLAGIRWRTAGKQLVRPPGGNCWSVGRRSWWSPLLAVGRQRRTSRLLLVRVPTAIVVNVTAHQTGSQMD